MHVKVTTLMWNLKMYLLTDALIFSQIDITILRYNWHHTENYEIYAVIVSHQLYCPPYNFSYQPNKLKVVIKYIKVLQQE